jgi:predicted house-cleaning noncanonical NTP pyrophosphatase (MazG superfamily)
MKTDTKKKQEPIIKLIRNKLKESIEQKEALTPLREKEKTKFGVAVFLDQQQDFVVEKIAEEATKLLNAFREGDILKAREEFGDLLDVVDLLSSLPNFHPNLINKLRSWKNKQNGGFDEWNIAFFHPATFAKLYAKKVSLQKEKPTKAKKANKAKKRKPR